MYSSIKNYFYPITWYISLKGLLSCTYEEKEYTLICCYFYHFPEYVFPNSSRYLITIFLYYDSK